MLSEPTNGAIFRADTDGKEETDICTVTIESDGGVRTKVDRVMHLLAIDRQRDQHRPARQAGDEGPRAIDRVEHPFTAIAARLAAEFLAQNAIIGALCL